MATAPYAPHADCRKEGAPHGAPHWYVTAMFGIVYQSTMERWVNHAVIITGLGDYTRNVGYKTGAITYEFETKTFNYDRGIRIFADVMDVEEG